MIQVSRLRQVTEIARFEGARVLRNPITWAGVVLSAWLMWASGSNLAPILERESILLAGWTLPLAACTLIVANGAALRQRKTPELLDSTPSSASLRIVGLQVGVLGPVLFAVCLQTIGLIYFLAGGPIGSIDWLEFAGGPAAVGLLGVGGTFLGRRLPHPLVPLVALVGLGMLLLVAQHEFQIFQTPTPAANFEWLAPWIGASSWVPIGEVLKRPSALHLLYLIILMVTVAALAIPLRAKGSAVRMAGVVVVAAAIAAISLSLPSNVPLNDDSDAWQEAAANQVCAVIDGIEYCAFDLSAEWIPRWQQTVAAVNALAPVGAHKVMQRPHNIGFEEIGALNDDDLILVAMRWDREGAAPYFRLDLALRAAYSAVGLPTTLQIRPYTDEEIQSIVDLNPGMSGDQIASLERANSEHECSSLGQARAVVAMWLAGSSMDQGAEGLSSVLDRHNWNLYFSFDHVHRGPILRGVADAGLALDLLELPMAQVQGELETRWDEVVNPETSSATLAAWFDLAPPQTAALDFYLEPC